MMIYFFDADKKYIGSRKLKDGESVPLSATTIPVTLKSGEQAHFTDGAWVVSSIPAEPQVEPQIDEDEIAQAELYAAIEASTTIAGLKAALLGGMDKSKGRVKATK